MKFSLSRLGAVLSAIMALLLAVPGLDGSVGGRLASTNARAIALYEEGMKLAGSDRFNEAIEKFKQAIQADSNFIQAHLRYMDAFQGVGRGNEVVGMYRNKVDANPDNPVYRYLLGRALKEMPEKRAEFLRAFQSDSTFYWAPYGIGGTYYVEGRLDEAVVYLNRALRLNPNMLDAVRLLGEVYLEKRMYLQAKDQFELGIQLDPADLGSYIMLGQVFSRMNRAESAEKTFLAAAGAAPKDPQPWYFLGLLYEMNENREKALGAYGKFLELSPEDELAPLVRRNIEKLK